MEIMRTKKFKIQNYSQVVDRINRLSVSVCKLWNVARYRCEQAWEETGELPSESELKRELRSHEKYKKLHSQTAQNVIEELWDAFESWFEKRKQDDTANPPGYRKHGDTYPKVSVTYKKGAVYYDAKNSRLKLSNGKSNNHLLLEVKGRPDARIQGIEMVRLVWNGERWQVHIVQREKVNPEAPGDGVCAIDLGIKNFATLAYDDGYTEIYPANKLKEDEYYFLKKIAKCNKSDSNKAKRLHRKRSRRRNHFLHALSKEIVEKCEKRGVGKIVVGDLKGVRKDNGNDNYNLRLSQWPYEKFIQLLSYKGEERGIKVIKADESHTSQKCSACGVVDSSNRVKRDLFKCSNCGIVLHADVNAALNILKKVTTLCGSNSCVAQPAVNLFAVRSGLRSSEEGKFHKMEQLQTLKDQLGSHLFQ